MAKPSEELIMENKVSRSTAVLTEDMRLVLTLGNGRWFSGRADWREKETRCQRATSSPWADDTLRRGTNQSMAALSRHCQRRTLEPRTTKRRIDRVEAGVGRNHQGIRVWGV